MTRHKHKADADTTHATWDVTQPIYQALGTGTVRVVTWFLFLVMIGSLVVAWAVYGV